MFLTPRILDLNLALGRGWEEAHASEGKETEAAFPAGPWQATRALRKPANQRKGVPHPKCTLSKQRSLWKQVAGGRGQRPPEHPGQKVPAVEAGCLLCPLAVACAALERV